MQSFVEDPDMSRLTKEQIDLCNHHLKMLHPLEDEDLEHVFPILSKFIPKWKSCCRKRKCKSQVLSETRDLVSRLKKRDSSDTFDIYPGFKKNDHDC